MVGQLVYPTNPVLSETVASILSKVGRKKDSKILSVFFFSPFGFSNSAFLFQDPETPVEDVAKKITEDHPEWSVSDRRVKKFAKRYLRKVSGTSTDDEDTTISELSGKSGSKTASLMQRLFSPMKRETKDDATEPEKLMSVPEPAPGVEVSIDEAKAYVDENTSENENCECNACVIC